MEHIHIGLTHALTTFLMLIPLFFFWRVLSYHLAASDHPLGKAMAVIF